MNKAAIFDMDGLMYDTERVSTKAWLKTAEEMKFPLTLQQCDCFRGSNKEYKRQLFQKWYQDRVDYEKAYARKQELAEEFLKEQGVPVKKGLLELLAALKEHQYKIAVATSSARRKAESYWRSTGVYPYLDDSICGDEVTKSKPDPEIFLKAADKMGVPIENCIILEDSPNGLQAAHDAGGIVVMVPDMQQPDEELKKICNYIFDDLSQVIAVL